MPEAFTSKTRKANKEHRCCECGITIKKGEKYQYSSGIWDREADSFKQCLNCNTIMEKASLYAAMDDWGTEGPCFHGLHEWFQSFECISFTGVTFLKGMADTVNVPVEDLNKLLKIDYDN